MIMGVSSNHVICSIKLYGKDETLSIIILKIFQRASSNLNLKQQSRMNPTSLHLQMDRDLSHGTVVIILRMNEALGLHEQPCEYDCHLCDGPSVNSKALVKCAHAHWASWSPIALLWLDRWSLLRQRLRPRVCSFWKGASWTMGSRSSQHYGLVALSVILMMWLISYKTCTWWRAKLHWRCPCVSRARNHQGYASVKESWPCR